MRLTAGGRPLSEIKIRKMLVVLLSSIILAGGFSGIVQAEDSDLKGVDGTAPDAALVEQYESAGVPQDDAALDLAMKEGTSFESPDEGDSEVGNQDAGCVEMLAQGDESNEANDLDDGKLTATASNDLANATITLDTSGTLSEWWSNDDDDLPEKYMTVKLGSKTLKANRDYYVSSWSRTESLDYDSVLIDITITGCGNNTGKKEKSFTVYAKIDAKGATKMPVGATAAYTVNDYGRLCLKSNGKWTDSNSIVSISHKYFSDDSVTEVTSKCVITSKKAGSTTLYVLDYSFNVIKTIKLTVYSITSGTYEIQSALDKSLVLDIQKKSTANSARMLVYERNDGKNQRYQFVAQKDGTYAIKCVHSGKYVDVQGGGTNQGQAVIQYAWNGGKNQKWYATVDASNYVTFISAQSKMCFDIKGGKAKSGACMIQWPSNNGKNQKWVLNKK